MDFLEYVALRLLPCNTYELKNHLAMNGYRFILHENPLILFVFIEEVDYIMTILDDRGIRYSPETY